MQKSLKKVHDQLLKHNQTHAGIKEEKAKVEKEIAEIKAGVKNDAKKGVFSILQVSDQDKLAKLISRREVLSVQEQALNELGLNDGILEATVNYLDKALTKEKETIEQMNDEMKKAEEEIKKYQKILSDNDFYAKQRVKNRLFVEVKSNLMGLAAHGIDMNKCRDLQELKKVLQEKLSHE